MDFYGEGPRVYSFFLYKNSSLAIVMTTAMTLNLILAAIMGVMIPLILSKSGRDPAVGSSVLITAMTDSGGFFYLFRTSNFSSYILSYDFPTL